LGCADCDIQFAYEARRYSRNETTPKDRIEAAAVRWVPMPI
jgi:hypothetical protein